MQVNQEVNFEHYSISRYDEDAITISLPLSKRRLEPVVGDEQIKTVINSQVLHHSLIIMPDQLIEDWEPQDINSLEQAHFDVLLPLQLEVILLGTGKTLQWPDPAVTAKLISLGIGVEVMNTGAACRTYNILMADQRRFAAALIMD